MHGARFLAYSHARKRQPREFTSPDERMIVDEPENAHAKIVRMDAEIANLQFGHLNFSSQ